MHSLLSVVHHHRWRPVIQATPSLVAVVPSLFLLSSASGVYLVQCCTQLQMRCSGTSHHQRVEEAAMGTECK